MNRPLQLDKLRRKPALILSRYASFEFEQFRAGGVGASIGVSLESGWVTCHCRRTALKAAMSCVDTALSLRTSFRVGLSVSKARGGPEESSGVEERTK
jgi:hypothetical protein